MVTTQAVIDRMNLMTSTPVQEEIPGIESEAAVELGEQPVQEDQPAQEEQLVQDEQQILEEQQVLEQSILEEQVEPQPERTEGLDTQPNETIDTAIVLVRRSARIAGGIQQPQ